MDKRRVSTIAAGILMAAMVIVTGCKPNQPVEPAPSVPPTTNPQGPNTNAPSVSEGDIAGASVEFSGMVAIGALRVTVAGNAASVWFKEHASGKEYVGNGSVAANGVLDFALQVVNNAKDTIPFKAVYNSKAQSFVVTKLTDKYPYDPVAITKHEQGNVKGYQRTFIRKVPNLKNGLDKDDNGNEKKNIAGTFFIALDADKVLVTVFYGNSDVGMSSVTKMASLEGNIVRMDLELAGVTYKLKLVFNEDANPEHGASDTNTVWYLGRLNERYNPNTSTGEPEYVGGFYLSEAGTVAGPQMAELDDRIVASKTGLKLYKDKTPSETDRLGTLDIDIRGSWVTLKMTNTEGEVQEKHVSLKRQSIRPHLWESEALGTARTKAAGAPAVDHVVATDKTVFAFLHELGAGGTNTNTYDTFDFKISDYDPKTGKLCLTGRYLLEKNPQAANMGGSALISDGTGDQIYLWVSNLNSMILEAPGVPF